MKKIILLVIMLRLQEYMKIKMEVKIKGGA